MILSIGPNLELTFAEFHEVVYAHRKVALSSDCNLRLRKTRTFIEKLEKTERKVYGFTTGFADLRDTYVPPDKAAELSLNLIRSHDAGIGTPLPLDIVRGAMLVRIVSLAKGHSGFSERNLQVLVDMLNEDIIPDVPCYGSLGASGDLAYFARLGRAMLGNPVPVTHRGIKKTADRALEDCNISPFIPLSKEGLALLNGTSFMASMLAISLQREIHEFETSMALQALFLNAISALDTPFAESIQTVRKQTGQILIAKVLQEFLTGSPFPDRDKVQDDYSIRCLPQIFGPKLDIILSQAKVIERELNAVTDNPLIFCNKEIPDTITADQKIECDGDVWAVLSGGNFHGEYLATAADAIATANAKIALTLERQITYVLNPRRNGAVLPCYLIADSSKKGLMSGFMITQYTANALTQKISQLGIPASIFNITSANESEDVVSYGATAGLKLLEQLENMKQLNAIYATVMMQAYSFARNRETPESELTCEKIFLAVQAQVKEDFPIVTDVPFDEYTRMAEVLAGSEIRDLIGRPYESLIVGGPLGA